MKVGEEREGEGRKNGQSGSEQEKGKSRSFQMKQNAAFYLRAGGPPDLSAKNSGR